jgi:molybdopterin-binding protein
VSIDLVDGTITRITEGSDATSVEVTIASGKPLIWTVPNMMFARLGYAVGSSVCANIDSFGNLQGVRPRT